MRDSRPDQMSAPDCASLHPGYVCYVCYGDARELIEGYADSVEFGRDWKHALSFRWGSLMREGVSAYMAATAYARATGGVVYDPQDGKIMTPAELREVVHQLEKHVQ